MVKVDRRARAIKKNENGQLGLSGQQKARIATLAETTSIAEMARLAIKARITRLAKKA